MAGRARELLVGIAMALAACVAPGAGDPTPPPNGPDPATIRYSCVGPPGFLPSLFDQPARAELEDHPSAQALRTFVAEDRMGLGFLPDEGWWLVHRDGREAQYVVRLPDDHESPFGYVTIQAGVEGWAFAGGGDCRPLAMLDGRSQVTWTLTKDHPVGPATIEFPVLVTEMGCTSGAAVGPRLLPPTITYTDQAIHIVFSARPLEGGGGGLCIGIAPTPAGVRLREPLGHRLLLDAGVYPPGEPSPDPFAGA